MSNPIIKAGLLATTVIAGMAFAGPAFAQAVDAPGANQQQNPSQPAEAEDASTQPATQAPAPGEPTAGTVADTEGDDTIVVTGTILRATSRATPSPVTVLDMDESEKRGNNTVNDAIQTLSANGAGTLPNSFTANGAFAAGASAASLRGLLTSNTLVLFDGLRAAYYPLADDGTRNFVDLNTIPDAIVDRVEVLKDGASSTYGADAVAGVINIITKRQITGLHLEGQAGIAQRGHGRELNTSATYGIGDLDDDGFNVYATGMYMDVKGIKQSDLRAPFNSGNLCDRDISSGLYFGECGTFNINAPAAFFVRPSGPNNNILPSNAANPTRSDFQLLNPAQGCNGLPEYNLTPEEQAQVPFYPSTICSDDFVANYGNVTTNLRRWGGSARGTLNVSDNIEAYVMGNYVHSRAWYQGFPARLRRGTPPGASGITTTTANLALPVFVCSQGQGATAAGQTVYTGCTNPDGTPAAGAVLNPNNPFAAQGSFARVTGFINGFRESDDIRTGAWRLATGLRGTFMNDFRFNVEATTMRVKNTWTQNGLPYTANLLDAIATGSLNLVNFDQNSQETLDFVFPENRNVSTSRLSQLQASVSKDLFELPGGPLQVGIGAQIRREEIDAPSANPDRDTNGNPLGPEDFEGLTQAQIAALVDPDQRYSSGINPFGTVGERTVKSAYGEIAAPVFNSLDVNLSGRFDRYSSGQKAFSPKAGVKFTPVREVAFRGTWSKGFRIGSFAESFALPTTGYIPGNGTVPAAYAALFPGGSSNQYIANYSVGLTQVGNPDLDPERSRNVTIGVVAEPIRNVSFSVDFWDIRKTDVITGADYTPALAAYYAGQPVPSGFVIIPDAILPQEFGAPAGTIPRAQFVQYSYENAARQRAQGIDFAASAKVPVSSGLTFSTNLEGSYLRRLATCFEGTGCQEYAGTIGPYVITSAAGSPRWRGSWQNTLEFGRAYTTLTGFYTSGYKTTAEDITGADSSDDCHNTVGSHFISDGEPVQCRVKRTLYWNLGAGVDVNDRINLYMNVLNLFDKKPPLDYATYGAYLYNPAWANPLAIGRFFRVGAKMNF